MSDATRKIEALQRGDRPSAGQLLPLVYDELRRLAAHKMAQESPGHTLQPTAVLHEAYLRLTGCDPSHPWDGRTHFFAAAAEAMRRILIESARRKSPLKHGGQMERVNVDDVELPLPMPDDELLALDEALDHLATVDTRAAEMVRL